MATLHDILEHKGRSVHKLPATATVREAVEQMCAQRVGALLVTDKDHPVGMLSERDVLNRVVLQDRSPSQTVVAEVMTRDVVVVAIDTTPEQAMAIMTEKRCRHLPVIVERRVVGLVSIGDLVRWASRHQEYEIEWLHDYLSGRYPG